MEIKHVAIIGSGIMGHGIAQVCATAGLSACLCDLSQDLLDRALSNISDSLDRGVKKGKINEAEKSGILARITLETSLPDAVKEVDLVIEAVVENLGVKQQLFKELDRAARPDAILASNTSQFSITEIAGAVSDPSRVIGMHWFNPPVIMKLIEVIKGLETSADVVSDIRAFADRTGKEVVLCEDSQGFISTRVLVAMRLECYRILQEGIATKADIDKTLKLAFGHPMGQFELADFSGLDTELEACNALFRVFGDRFRPTQNLMQLVHAGRHGRKNGAGWFRYNTESK